ncbi:MAG: lipoprotein [Gammaproteobacteria bacterium]
MQKSFLPLLFVVLLAGCSSFGEGLGRALLQKEEKEDTRQCYVRGPSFDGIEQLITRTEQEGEAGAELKVLMVHGIGMHQPGYSIRMAENLARELQLDVVDREPKVIKLRLNISKEKFAEAARRGDIRGKPGDVNGTLTVRTNGIL